MVYYFIVLCELNSNLCVHSQRPNIVAVGLAWNTDSEEGEEMNDTDCVEEYKFARKTCIAAAKRRARSYTLNIKSTAFFNTLVFLLLLI